MTVAIACAVVAVLFLFALAVLCALAVLGKLIDQTLDDL